MLAGQAVTNTGSSVLLGDVGVSPGTAVTGFPPGLVVGGTIHSADAVSLQAQADNTAGYGLLAGQLCTQDMTGTDLGGLTLTAGTYCFSSSAQLTGTLTLDAAGDPNAAFVFQIGSTLTTASNSSVVLINGAQTCNVYWQVGSSATVGTTSTFVGNILALTSITLTTGATVVGRALAQNGAVTLDSNIITLSICTKELDGGTSGGATTCDGTVCDCGCVDTDTDALNCGACGTSCAAGQTCTAGSCGPQCLGTQYQCGGSCIDPTTDDNNCGACGNACAPGVACNGGYCGACPGLVCGSWCVDVGTDRNHCGACDSKCSANETCTAGACQPCAGARCGNACVDAMTDQANCGACGTECSSTETCTNGSCSQSCETP